MEMETSSLPPRRLIGQVPVDERVFGSGPGVVRVRVYRDSAVHVILSGEIDGASEQALMLAAEKAGGFCLPVRVDLGEVTFMDSSGLGLLVRLARKSGPIRVDRAPETVRFLLEIAGMEHLLGEP